MSGSTSSATTNAGPVSPSPKSRIATIAYTISGTLAARYTKSKKKFFA